MPNRSEDLPFAVNLRRINKGVGYVALLLPALLLAVTGVTGTCFYATISHYYFSRIGGDLFVGSLSFIGVMLTFFYVIEPGRTDGYLEHRRMDIALVRLAGICALAIAFLPTTGSGCAYHAGYGARAFLTDLQGSEAFLPAIGAVTGTVTHDFWASFERFGSPAEVPVALASLHFGAAAVMFSILGYFSACVFTRQNSATSRGADEPGSRKASRNRWYRGLGLAIYVAAGIIGFKFAVTQWALSAPSAERVSAIWDRWHVTFVCETVALMSFGLSWLIKGRFLAVFEDEVARPGSQRRDA